jgi:CRP-like cAMP-binding protein
MLELSPKQLLDVFAKVSFFEFFTIAEKELVANFKSNMLGFTNGQYIIRQGDTDNSVYILLKGKANITKKEKASVIINTLKAGAVFGEIAFFCSKTRSTNVIANGSAMVLKMEWALFEQLPEEVKNKIKDKLIEVLIQRLEDMNKVLLDQSRT